MKPAACRSPTAAACPSPGSLQPAAAHLQRLDLPLDGSVLLLQVLAVAGQPAQLVLGHLDLQPQHLLLGLQALQDQLLLHLGPAWQQEQVGGVGGMCQEGAGPGPRARRGTLQGKG
jgi:hypothetical protein